MKTKKIFSHNHSSSGGRNVTGLIFLLTVGVITVTGIFWYWNSSVYPQTSNSQKAEEMHDYNNHTESNGDTHLNQGKSDTHNHTAEPDSEKSCLDRTLDELWSAQCEHDILQYTCDECRYELGIVKLDPSLITTSNKAGIIATTVAESSNVTKSLMLTGEVQVSETKTVYVTSPLPGIVRQVLVQTGQLVSAGDILLQLESAELAEAKGAYLSNRAALTLAKKNAEREERLYAKKISAQVDAELANATLVQAQAELENVHALLHTLGLNDSDIKALEKSVKDCDKGLLYLRSVQSGVVLERQVSVGESIGPGKNLIVISDLSEVWIWADLKESELQTINLQNMKIDAEIEVPGMSGKHYQGMVGVIAGTINPQTRMAKIRIIISNAEKLLRPGMFVKVRLILPGARNSIVVPKVAVLSDEDRFFVFTHKEGDFWVQRPVLPGDSVGDLVEIKNGLARGQQIIADGSFLLKSDVLRKKMGAGCAD